MILDTEFNIFFFYYRFESIHYVTFPFLFPFCTLYFNSFQKSPFFTLGLSLNLLSHVLCIFSHYRKGDKFSLIHRKSETDARIKDFVFDVCKSRCCFVLSQVKVKALTIVFYTKVNYHNKECHTYF